ncbi:ATP-dependent DNA helicase sgs1 [Chytriomyces hyalinus]|nr:ATP-dependent DNA helicase sgs1 [Chytriomyces hyalinus]
MGEDMDIAVTLLLSEQQSTNSNSSPFTRSTTNPPATATRSQHTTTPHYTAVSDPPADMLERRNPPEQQIPAIQLDNFVEKFSKVISNLFKLAEGQKQVTCISGSPVEALHNAQLSHTNKRTDFHQTYTPRVKLTTIRMNEGHLAAIEVLIKAAGEAVSLSVEDYFNLQFSSAKSIRSMAYNHQHADEQAKQRAKIADDRYNSIVNVDLGQTFVQYKEARIQECYIPAILSSNHVLTIFICLLIALVKGHHQSCEKLGLKSAFLCSETHHREKKKILQDLAHQNLDLLFTTPESFISRNFSALMDELVLEDFSFIFVLEEAHCITDWPGGERGAYETVTHNIQAYVNCKLVFMSATLAEDAIDQILNLFRPDAEPDRCEYTDDNLLPNNIQFEVSQAGTKKIELIANWIDSLAFNKKGIIFVQTAKEADEYATKLSALLQHIKFETFYSRKSALEKSKIIEDLTSGVIHVLIATWAFSMGMDIASFNFAIHYACPASITSLAQEFGRSATWNYGQVYVKKLLV